MDFIIITYYFLGETWNILKINFQLKQVRERIGKGLVDKGILRTEKKNFVIFDMATHPLSDTIVKEKVIKKVIDCLLCRGPQADRRTIALVCAAYAANVLENALIGLNPSQRDKCFQKADDLIYLIGESRNDINSSQYLVSIHGVRQSPAPYFNMEVELDMQHAVLNLIENGLVVSAHDVSDGGLFTTLAESAFVNKLGFKITSDDSVRNDAFLFGESQGRVVVSVSPGKEEEFVEFMALTDVPFSLIGSVTSSAILVDEESWGNMEDFEMGYQNSLPAIMD